MTKEFKTVLYEVKDKVLTITMNRPDKLNAVSMCLYHLTHAVDAQEGSQSFFEKRDPEWKMKPSMDMPYFHPRWEGREFPAQLDLV